MKKKKHLIYVHTIWSKLGLVLFILFIVQTMFYAIRIISFWDMIIFTFLGAIGSLLWVMCKKEVYLNDKEYSLYMLKSIIG